MNDQIQQLQARIADLEAQLYAIGAISVRQSIRPQAQTDIVAPAQPPATRQESVASRTSL